MRTWPSIKKKSLKWNLKYTLVVYTQVRQEHLYFTAVHWNDGSIVSRSVLGLLTPATWQLISQLISLLLFSPELQPVRYSLYTSS